MSALPDAPGQSFAGMTNLLSSCAGMLGPTPVSVNLLLAVCWEESLFNNVFQGDGGTGIGFAQTEPAEFYRFNGNNLNNPRSPNMQARAKQAQAKGYIVMGLPPLIPVGHKRLKAGGSLSDQTAAQTICALARDLYETVDGKGHKMGQAGILAGLAGVGFKTEETGDKVPDRLAKKGAREEIIAKWLQCESGLNNAKTNDDRLRALKISREFNQDDKFRKILFGDSPSQ